MPGADDVFHDGERSVQRRAGAPEIAERLGPRMIADTLGQDFAAFLSAQWFAIVASSTPDGAVWASVLFGRRGFIAVPDPGRLLLGDLPLAGDPLADALAAGPVDAGLLVIDAMTRTRIRVNGVARPVEGGVELRVREVFGNCPKYIQRRMPVDVVGEGKVDPTVHRSSVLEARALELVTRTDTFFIASRHAERGADASHRGGRPGFLVASEEGRHLTFPDYRGNSMFQTLGNLTVDPAVGLLVLDWDRGATLQCSGRAEIVWDPERIAAWPKAHRLIEVELDAVVFREVGFPLRWQLIEASQLNPELPDRHDLGDER